MDITRKFLKLEVLSSESKTPGVRFHSWYLNKPRWFWCTHHFEKHFKCFLMKSSILLASWRQNEGKKVDLNKPTHACLSYQNLSFSFPSCNILPLAKSFSLGLPSVHFLHVLLSIGPCKSYSLLWIVFHFSFQFFLLTYKGYIWISAKFHFRPSPFAEFLD